MRRYLAPVQAALLWVLTRLNPRKNAVVFESNPDCSDNAKAVFDEFIARGLNRKYKLVWALYSSQPNKYPRIKNVKYLSGKSFMLSMYLWKAKAIVFCNRYFEKTSATTKTFYLQHASALKRITSYDKGLPKTTDYVIDQAKAFMEIDKKRYRHIEGAIVSLGFARNDILVQPKNGRQGLLQVFAGTSFQKAVIWMPTFRTSKYNGHKFLNKSISIIDDNNNLLRLEAFLEQNGILLVIKTHPAQMPFSMNDCKTRNIFLVDDAFISGLCMTNYEFLSLFDALLTDYSSVYYDYTLCNKPIGLIWEDIEDFRERIGFEVDPEVYLSGGVKIYNYDDLVSFLSDVRDEKDTLKEERKKNCIMCNYSVEGESAIRVADFIISKANL